ncbi:MAG: succinylglutamate desuccinylase [Polyangiales bacterium]
MTHVLETYLRVVLDGGHETGVHGALPLGGHWRVLGDGMLELAPADTAGRDADVLVSAGVHGDETAPIELCDLVIRDVAAGRLPLAARVMFVFGSLAGMRVGRRYLDDDLNRLFRPLGVAEAAALAASPRPDSVEGRRVVELEAAVRAFFRQGPALRNGGSRLHFDLHTAIRGSQFERFALCPFRSDGLWDREQLAWLADNGVEAVLLNDRPAGTFSYFTSAELGVSALTLELGAARPFGKNDLSRFEAIDRGLRRLLSGARKPRDTQRTPRMFRVVHVLIKRTDQFRLHVADDVLNFTAFPRGTLIAEDGDQRYVTTHDDERVIFPNKHVKNGLRAGMMVVEC